MAIGVQVTRDRPETRWKNVPGINWDEDDDDDCKDK